MRNGSQDLVIDDDVEGETLVGSGKAGLMDKEDIKDPLPIPQRLQARPISAKKKGLSGPISSNLEVSWSGPKSIRITRNVDFYNHFT